MMLTLPYPPSDNRLYRKGADGHIYKAKEHAAYQADIGWRCKEHGIQPIDGPVHLTMRIYRPRRDRDMSNCEKALQDALQGHWYHNDKQIACKWVEMFDDKTNPRVEVECRPVTERPLPEWVTA
jgi:Holliday junction resolvase RusA-like endonuclease